MNTDSLEKVWVSTRYVGVSNYNLIIQNSAKVNDEINRSIKLLEDFSIMHYSSNEMNS